MRKLKLHWQILIALVLALILGVLFGGQPKESLAYEWPLAVFTFVGDLFMRGLKMIVVPLIVASVIAAIARLGGGQNLGRLGGKTALYYVATSFISILVGLTLVNLIQPGIMDPAEAEAFIANNAGAEQVASKVAGRSAGDVSGVFLRMVPKNVVHAAANTDMLGLIFFSIVFGYYSTKLKDEYGSVMVKFWVGVYEVMLKITDFVLIFAPIGVLGLVGKVVMTTGTGFLDEVGLFFLTVVAALAIHTFVVLPLILLLVGRVQPQRQFTAMAPAMLMAFSTASSASTLPLTMECVRERAGVSERVTNFVLPLGATVNMDGTALYECVAVMFIAQLYQVELGFAQQVLVVSLALLTSIGVAGIPAASLVAITLILTSVGLPLEAAGLILAVDRILDMCRTAVNVFSDSCGAVVIARTEGEQQVLAQPAPV